MAEGTKKKTAKKSSAKKPSAAKKTMKAAPEKKTDTRACKIDKCKQPYRAKGYCRKHYKKWRQGEYGLARYKTCNATDCRKPMLVNGRGYCETHYQEKILKKGKVTEEAPVAEEAEKPAGEAPAEGAA